MRYRSLQLCLAVGAFAAGSALASTTTDSFAFITGGSRIGLLFSGGAVGVTLGAFIAAVVAWGVRVPSHRALAAAVGLVDPALHVEVSDRQRRGIDDPVLGGLERGVDRVIAETEVVRELRVADPGGRRRTRAPRLSVGERIRSACFIR